MSSLDQLAVDTIRGLTMDAVQAASSGHPGAPMGLAPLGWALFSRLRRHDPARPEWPDRDRFVLSCGHASMLLYALHHLSGYPGMGLDELRNFRQWGSATPGHPEYGHTPGVETTTGPLGQGFANGVGMAMAERHLAARFNRAGHELFDHTTWVFASDGDLMEGISAEAASLAGHLRLSKLVVFWDDNKITIDGSTELAFTEDVCARFRAYGWVVVETEEGDDVEALVAAAQQARDQAREQGRPALVRVRTVIGHPAPNKRDTSSAHGAPLGPDEVAATKQLMGWPEAPFHVPGELAAATQGIGERGATLSSEWDGKLDAYREAFPADAAALEAVLAGDLRNGWDASLPSFEADAKGLATRKASGAVLAAVQERLGGLVGGSADLAGSNNSYMKGLADFSGDGAATAVPRNVHWGIREHAMAAAVNGMALHGGVIPYGATFLVFSDYMRPSIRLACLMGLRTRYLFTHDSIGVGEDGPTHQPVEHLAALRAIPGMCVLRPGDANEVVACWRAMLLRDGPAALVLTRQNVPTLDRAGEGFASADDAGRGAYVLAPGDDAILVATGSELSLAVEARALLAAEGIEARVVSMPSWELFAEQDAAYRASVFPPSVRARVVVEAGTRFGWERWVGMDAAFVTLERFGASAPAGELFQHFGFTPEAVAQAAKEQLARV